MSVSERIGTPMENAILFANSFLSYLLLVAIIAGLVGLAIFIGIKMRISKNTKEANATQEMKEEP